MKKGFVQNKNLCWVLIIHISLSVWECCIVNLIISGRQSCDITHMTQHGLQSGSIMGLRPTVDRSTHCSTHTAAHTLHAHINSPSSLWLSSDVPTALRISILQFSSGGLGTSNKQRETSLCYHRDLSTAQCRVVQHFSTILSLASTSTAR